MLNKKLNFIKVFSAVFFSIIVFAFMVTYPAIFAAKNLIDVDVRELVDSVKLTEIKVQVNSDAFDPDTGKKTKITETETVADVIIKIISVPGLTCEGVDAIYEESDVKDFLVKKLTMIIDAVKSGGNDLSSDPVITANELKELVRENAYIIKKHTGYEITEKDYSAIDEFYSSNPGLFEDLTPRGINKRTRVTGGDFSTFVTVILIVVSMIILIIALSELLISRNLKFVLILNGITAFLAGITSLIAAVSAKASLLSELFDSSRFIGFLAETIAPPFLVCGIIMTVVGILLTVAAVVLSKTFGKEYGNEKEDDGEFDYEYQMQPAAGVSASAASYDSDQWSQPWLASYGNGSQDAGRNQTVTGQPDDGRQYIQTSLNHTAYYKDPDAEPSAGDDRSDGNR